MDITTLEQKFALGSKSKAICETCSSIVDTTFKLRDIKLSDGSKVIKDLIVGVCDNCDETVSIPSTQTPKIKEALEFKQ